ncbi:MAG: hypothetical protein ABR571_07630 [Jatrophihabitans sp.]|uniref:hypothetical protein n=1 Tax=Jatrophihabitans sp. TaxID=1932789 RepID=UPI00390F3DEE
MSDTYMAKWWHILGEAVAEADRRCDGEIPWHNSYADVFPDAQALRRALGYYWEIRIGGPIEVADCPDAAHSHRGLRMVLSPRQPERAPERRTCRDRVVGILRSAVAPTA